MINEKEKRVLGSEVFEFIEKLNNEQAPWSLEEVINKYAKGNKEKEKNITIGAMIFARFMQTSLSFRKQIEETYK